MTAFTLLYVPGGRAILTTTQSLDDAQVEAVRAAVRAWESPTGPDVLVVSECEVVQVAEIDIDLTPRAGLVS